MTPAHRKFALGDVEVRFSVEDLRELEDWFEPLKQKEEEF